MTPDAALPRVHRFEKRSGDFGWSLNMLAVELPDRGLLVYSPAWLGPDTFEKLDALGEVRVLVAPNAYHHLSLQRFRDHYPAAIPVASDVAIPRLTKKGHAALQPLSAAAPHLPNGARFLVPEGLRTGEAWLSVPGDTGPTWLVCDAWFNVNRPLTGFPGFLLRALKTGPGLAVGLTFRFLALADRRAYVDHARTALESEQPTTVFPSHGDPIVADAGAPAHHRARTILDTRLG